MTFLTSVERSMDTATPFSPLGAVVNWVRLAIKQREKQVAFRNLLAMDESRLNDLGLTRRDVIEALHGGPSLFSKRAERAQRTLKNK